MSATACVCGYDVFILFIRKSDQKKKKKGERRMSGVLIPVSQSARCVQRPFRARPKPGTGSFFQLSLADQGRKDLVRLSLLSQSHLAGRSFGVELAALWDAARMPRCLRRERYQLCQGAGPRRPFSLEILEDCLSDLKEQASRRGGCGRKL